MKSLLVLIGLAVGTQAIAAISCGQDTRNGKLYAVVFINGKEAGSANAGKDFALQGEMISKCNELSRQGGACVSQYHKAKAEVGSKYSEYWEPGYPAYTDYKFKKSGLFSKSYRTGEACEAAAIVSALQDLK